MLAAGVVIEGGSVRNSIFSSSVKVEEMAIANRSILFDGVTVGANARSRNCIVDKCVKIPAGERIGFDRASDETRFTDSDKGIVVVPKGYQFPPRIERAEAEVSVGVEPKPIREAVRSGLAVS
jgi:glucose-1-phosphate adenylyltransferase